MERYMRTCMFLCFHVKFKHESTKTCMFPCNLLSLIFFFGGGGGGFLYSLRKLIISMSLQCIRCTKLTSISNSSGGKFAASTLSASIRSKIVLERVL